MSIFGADIKIGSVVHYVMQPADYRDGATRTGPAHRPAIILDVLKPPETPQQGPTTPSVGLVVFLAGVEDGQGKLNPQLIPPPVGCTLWKPAVFQSGDLVPGTWHWPDQCH